MSRRLFGSGGLVALGVAFGMLLGIVVAPPRERGDQNGAAEQPPPGEQKQHGQGDPERSTAERASLVVSLLIVALLVGALTYLEFAGDSSPATIAVRPRPEAVRVVGDLHYLPLDIANEGDAAAEAIRVRVVVGEGNEADTIEVEVDRLAAGAEQAAMAILRRDPRAVPLRAQVVSFLDP